MDGARPENAVAPAPEPPKTELPDEGSPPVDPQELLGKLDATMAMFSGRDQQELAQRGEKAAQWLETRSSVEAIEGIGGVVRRAAGARTRAYAPVIPPPPGDFEYDTMLPYAVSHTTAQDGSVRVGYTWVDEQGRAMLVEMAEEASDPALTAALKMAERSPMMRQLFQSSVLPILESQLRQRQ